MLAFGALCWRMSEPKVPAEAPITESETPETVAPQRAGNRLQPAARPASTRVVTSRSANQSPPPAQKLFVEWKGTWYAAEILASAAGSNYIRYSGYGAEWDEWVTPERMRYSDAQSAPPENAGTQTDSSLAQTARITTDYSRAQTALPEPTTLPEPEIKPSKFVQGNPAKGDLLVEWGKQWWPAEILKQEGGSYFIHYKDYGTNWDEWVTLERIGHYTGAE